MKKRLKKKIERKGMSNKQLVKFYAGVVFRQNQVIERKTVAIISAANRIFEAVKENIQLVKDYDKLEKQNMAMTLQSIRLREEVKFLNEEINEMRLKKPWLKKVLGL